ncbi:winged helix-turn-helix domain-containing protein [Streptomyces sp. NBC_01012]|uniref:winged helix-turn-helix domain-containing protein n=1 Tax=Streptomyces sp. NBC_01012 TaxID=2903717 RepID=UPI0038644DD0|nr:transcriptional regulator [Streptomyces sp. NBC_01012]
MPTPPERSSAPVLNELIHQPTRLTVLSFLSGCSEAEFRAVKEECALSDSSLSKIVKTLEDAGYLTVRKGYVGKRPRTWLRISPEGRRALAEHLTALQAIVDRAATRGGAAGSAPEPGSDGLSHRESR